MKRTMPRLALPLTAAALCAAGVSAAELHVAVSAMPMTVDGIVNEYAYVGYDWSAPFIVFDRENAVTNGLFEPVGKPFSDLKTQCGVFTDETNLYAAVLAPCAAQQPPGKGDGVGVAVSFDGRSLLVAECGMEGKCDVWRFGQDGTRSPVEASGVRAGVKARKGSFEVEMAIPYAAIGRTPGRMGGIWRCNIYRKGPSCGGVSSWSPVQGDMFNPARFGRMVFSSDRRRNLSVPSDKENLATFLWSGERWGGDPFEPPPLDEAELGKVELFGPRGGRAVSHFRVSNLTDRPALYSLKPENFKKSELARRVRFREVGNVELKGGPTIPDPIFEMPNGSVLRIPPKSTAMVWVDVDTEGMSPSVHRATLKLVPGYSKFEEKSLALELTVGKADIREIDMPCWTYGVRNAADLRALRDYRFNVSGVVPPWFAPDIGPDGRRDWSKLDEIVEAILENGTRTNEVRILIYTLFPRWQNPRDSKEKERQLIDSMRAGIAYARERHGIGLDRIWYSTVDEPQGDPDDRKSLASHAFYGAALARRIDPGLKAWTNPYKSSETQWLARYLKEFDVLVPFLPVINDYDPAASERYARSGKEIWSYTIYLKQNRPVQYRGISWRNFAYGFEGPATFYTLTHMSGDGFNSYDSDGAADYGASYKDPRTGRISPSLRLEAWYQGHIEQRLAKWCRDRIARMRDSGKGAAFKARLDDIVKRAVAPRPNFDVLSFKLMKLSDEVWAEK